MECKCLPAFNLSERSCQQRLKVPLKVCGFVFNFNQGRSRQPTGDNYCSVSVLPPRHLIERFHHSRRHVVFACFPEPKAARSRRPTACPGDRRGGLTPRLLFRVRVQAGESGRRGRGKPRSSRQRRPPLGQGGWAELRGKTRVLGKRRVALRLPPERA